MAPTLNSLPYCVLWLELYYIGFSTSKMKESNFFPLKLKNVFYLVWKKKSKTLFCMCSVGERDSDVKPQTEGGPGSQSAGI